MSRRPAVNPKPVGGNIRDDEPYKVGCPRCSVVMQLEPTLNILICYKCGYGIPPGFIQQQQEQQQKQPTTKTKVVTSDVSETIEPENIPLASKGTRTEELQKRHDPIQAIIDKDADVRRMKKQGATLISYTEHTEQGDKEVLSREELEKQRQLRNKARALSGSPDISSSSGAIDNNEERREGSGLKV